MNILHATNPFNPHERDTYFAPDELTIDEFLDKNNLSFTRPTVCVVNGSEGVLKADYAKVKVSDFETMVFVTIPEDGDGGSNPLAMVAMIALTVFSSGLATAGLTAMGMSDAVTTSGFVFGLAKAAIMMVGSVLINAIIPPPKPPSTHQQTHASASPVYSLQAQGNSARLGSAIPEIFGTHRIYPDFAAMPYTEYNGDDQYLYQLFCLGVGEFVFNDIRIEDTPFANDEGGFDSRTVSFKVEVATVDDSGALTSAYSEIMNHSISAATSTPIRKSYHATVISERYIVRATRTNAKDTDARVGNDIQWTGLKAYIPGEQNYGDVTMFAMRARATNNLSQTSSRKVNLSVSRKLNTWDSTNGWSATKTVTSKPAWIAAYIAKTANDESRINLLELEALQATIDNRNVPFTENDEFNGVFDSTMTLWEALQLVGKVIRTMPIIQGGTLHWVRDQAQSIPSAMFSMRNIVKGSFSSVYLMPTDETTDAIEIEYFNADTLKPETVLCELNPDNSTTIAKVKLFGVTKRDHAYREGMYHASANKNRRILTTFKTELEGYIPTIGDLVVVSHDMPDWGQSGEVDLVEDYTAELYKLHLSEPLIEGTGQHYIVLRHKDGTPTNAINCTVDAVDKTVVVITKDDVDFTINDTDDFEHTHFSFGISTEMYQRCRVIPPLRPSGTNQVEINVVNESDAVHIADTGITPALDPVFDLPPPIVKPSIAVLNIN